MHHCPNLVECDVTVSGDADGEHQQAGGGRLALHHRAVERQVHCLAGGRVGQPGGPHHHAQRIGQGTGPIGAKRRVEVGGKALGIVGGQYRFIHRQRWLLTGGANARPIVLEDNPGADFGGRGRGLDQREATNIEIGVVITLGVEGRPILDEHAVMIRGCGVFNLVAGFNAGDGCNPARKADANGRIIHRSVRILDHQPGADVDDANIGDVNRRIVRIAVDEIHAGFGSGAECADFYDSTLAALQLHDVEVGRPGI